ncbi:uncharacterized protein BO87DRAFT_386347 [Aspergillus neoniger CBS 115656]|uniref:Uncharacterized protein n=1 Tax=Aspergillus neoniger (strain CBS 115656) TaxID=1448310 RepID=A0A318Z429_ASPNB|nr:hypothetical protein BO87DRAFT_386347 [Aspergillus neoniger CBS 115656]PYH34938.1 hypothetical protein BO87DRAFT_386347 [Aspergillus neoniger CBS 115656]
MGRPDSYHHFAGALGGCDPDEGEANKWIEWISGRMAWTVVGCEGWKPSRNRTAGSTVAGTPAPSFPVGWFPDLRIGDEGGGGGEKFSARIAWSLKLTNRGNDDKLKLLGEK